MPLPPTTRRPGPDACPGAVAVHRAADGGLARIRLPGGLLRRDQLDALRAIAGDLSDGYLELTSRANVQLRALAPGVEAELAARLHAAGLLPSASHETVRNIVASPFAGPELRRLVADLDADLCADPDLAALPGRFLFALDDGTGDVVRLRADVTLRDDFRVLLGGVDVVRLRADVTLRDNFTVLLSGVDVGLRTAADAAVATMLAAGRAFLAERAAQESAAWRLSELADGPARVASRLGCWPAGQRAADTSVTRPNPDAARSNSADTSADAARSNSADTSADAVLPYGRAVPADPSARPGTPVGVVALGDGRSAVAAVVPLGRLSAEQAAVLGRADVVIITPWRGVVVPDLSGADAEQWCADLAAAGLVTDPASPWIGVTTCAGRPGCAKSRADVRADATAAVEAASAPPAGAAVAAGPAAGTGAAALPVHWIGCERACGRPPVPHVEMLATAAGYERRSWRR